MTEKGGESRGEILIIHMTIKGGESTVVEKYSTDNMTEKGGQSKGEIMIIWPRKEEHLTEKFW